MSTDPSAPGERSAGPVSQAGETPAAVDDSEAEAAEDAARAGQHPLPPPTFHTLVSMLSTQALVGLGLIPHPATGKPTPNADLAKHFIDLLGVVEQKCRGNLESAEQRGLDAALHDLRMAYVQFIRRTN